MKLLIAAAFAALAAVLARIDECLAAHELAERGMEAFSGTPESFDKFLKEQLVVWEKLIRDAKIAF